MTRFLLPVLLLLASLAVFAPRDAAAGQRVALVIGNGAYRYAEPLATPAKDAQDVAEALRRLGFKVMVHRDLDRVRMERAFRGFARALGDADIALFYYAGHALQVDGRNYLVPVDAELASDIDIGFLLTGLDLVLRMMAQQPATGLVFLDASRPNPLAENLIDVQGDRVAVGRGLARVEPAPDSQITFAAAPGDLVEDAAGNNSRFTAALLRHIESPGVEIEEFNRRLRAQVKAESGGEQVPWTRSRLGAPEFTFVDPDAKAPTGLPEIPPEQAAEVPALPDREASFWSGIRESADWRDYQAYLDRFGEDAAFAPLALQRRDRLKAQESEAAAAEEEQRAEETAAAELPAPAPVPEPVPEPETAEEPAPEAAPLPQVAAAGSEPPGPEPAPEPLPEALQETTEEPAPPTAEEAPAPEAAQGEAPSEDSESAPEGASEELTEVPPIGDEPWGDEPWEETAGEEGQAEAAQRAQAEATPAKPAEPDPLEPLKIREAALGSGAKQRIQQALGSLELYDGPIDGLFGSGTRASIKRFQSAEGAEETGYLDEAQQTALIAKADAAALLASLRRESPGPAQVAPETPPPPAAAPEAPAAEAPAAEAPAAPEPVAAEQASREQAAELGSFEGAQASEGGAAEPPPAGGDSLVGGRQVTATGSGEPDEGSLEQDAPDESPTDGGTEPEDRETDWMARARALIGPGRADFEEDLRDYNENRNLFSKVTSAHDTRIDRVRALRVVSADSFGARIQATVSNKARSRNDNRTVTVTLDVRWSGADEERIVGHK